MKKVIFVFGSIKRKNKKSAFIQQISAYFAPMEIGVMLAKEMPEFEGDVLIFSNLSLKTESNITVVRLAGLDITSVINEINSFLC